jgi:hypothetical protein
MQVEDEENYETHLKTPVCKHVVETPPARLFLWIRNSFRPDRRGRCREREGVRPRGVGMYSFWLLWLIGEIWDAFCDTPGKINDGSHVVRTCDHVGRFKDDVAREDGPITVS